MTPSRSVLRSRRHVVGIKVAKTAIAGHDVRRTLFNRLIVAIPFDFAGPDLYHCAPRCVAGKGVTGSDFDQQQSHRASQGANYPHHAFPERTLVKRASPAARSKQAYNFILQRQLVEAFTAPAIAAACGGVHNVWQVRPRQVDR